MPLTLLSVHAHPDDESIMHGGILARYAAEGVRTVLVTCTGGEVGEIADPALATPENLAAVRDQELEAACRILGVAERVSLGYYDSGMMGTPANERAGCFWQADLDEAVGTLVAIIRRTRPDVIATYNEHGDYGHPDHIQAHRITVAAFQAAADPARYPDQGLAAWAARKLYIDAWPRSVFARQRRLMAEAGIAMETGEGEEDIEALLDTPDELVTTAVDVTDWVGTKRAAVLVHRTQMPADSFFVRMPESMWRAVWNTEYFRLLECRVPAAEREDDLFAGVR